MERLEIKASISVSDEGEIEGIAWPYGAGPDRIGDEITKGAFSSPSKLPMLFNHDSGQAVGVWSSVNETPAGLQVKGRLLVNDVERAREVRALVREGAVTGLSIGFVTKKAAPRKGGGRTISALDLHEVSIVPVPCHPAAQVTSVKGMDMEHAETAPEVSALETKVAEIAETVKAFDVKSFNILRDRLDKIEAKSNRPAGLADPVNDNVAVERKEFLGFCRKGADAVERKSALTEAGNTMLAPPTFVSELLKALVIVSPIRQYAKVMTVGGEVVNFPRRTAQAQASWVTNETDTRATSGPSYASVSIPNYELACQVPVSVKLLEDNYIDLEGELIADFAESFAKTEGAAFIGGTGVNQPTGLLTSTAITNVVHSGDAATIPTADTLISLFHSLPAVVAQSGVWVMNRNTLALIRKFKATTGEYLVLDGLADGAPVTLLGRPIVEAVDMPDVAAGANPIVFGDLKSSFRITDRIGVSVLRDPYSLAGQGQVVFHARRRVGADVVNGDRVAKLLIAA